MSDEFRYAVPLECAVPMDLPKPDGYPFSTEAADGWYVVITLSEDLAVVTDVRRSDWPLPDDVIDWRGAGGALGVVGEQE